MARLRRRFRRGAIAALSSQLIATGGQVLLVPLFLSAWGKQLYGEWLTLAAAVAYAGMADLGFSSYVVNLLNQHFAREERSALLGTLHSALSLLVRVSLIAFVCMASAAVALPLDEWFAFEEIGSGAGSLVAVLLSLQVIAAVPRGLIIGLYRAVEEYPRGVLLANVQRLAAIGLTAAALLGGAGPVGTAALQLVPLIATTFWALADFARRHPWIEIGTQRCVPGLAKTFIRPSLYFLAVQGSLVLVLQGSTITVGLVFGSGAVALFASLRTLANLVRQVSSSLSNALWPELTALAAREKWELLQSVHRTSVKCLTALSLGGAGFLALAGRDVFTLWTGGQLAFDPVLLHAFLALLVLQAPWTASSYVLLATNHHADLAKRQLVAGVLGLALGAWLATEYGPSGVLWGLLLAETALCGLTIPRAVVRLVGDSWPRYLAEVYGRGAFVAAVLLAVLGLTDLTPLPAPARILAAAVVSGGLTLSLTWFAWLMPAERSRLAGVLVPELRRAVHEPGGSA